jgi:cobalt-zinc-cadmium efflux system outer membrane protein
MPHHAMTVPTQARAVKWIVALVLAGLGCAPPRAPASSTTDPVRATTPRTSADETVVAAAADEQSAFERPADGQPGKLSFRDVVRETLRSDPRIRAAWQDVEEAQGELTTASLLPNPELDVGTSLQSLGAPFNAETRQGGPPQFDVGIAFPVDWLLFGKRAAAMRAAQSAADAAAEDFADVVRTRLLAVAKAFYDAWEAEAALTIEREDLADVRSLERITGELVGVGGAGSIERDRIRVAVLGREAEVRKSEADAIAATATLAAELGRAGGGAAIELDPTPDAVHPAEAPGLDDALAIARERRPDLLASRLRVKQTAEAVESEQRKAFPDVKPRLGYTRQFQEQSIGFPDVSAWGAGVETSLPVFDRNQGNVAKALAEQRRAEATLRTRDAEIAAEVARALAAYRASYSSVTAGSRARLDAAQAVRDKIEAAYRLGARPLLDVLDAQRTLRETLRLDLSERATLWRSAQELNSAVGKEIVP